MSFKKCNKCHNHSCSCRKIEINQPVEVHTGSAGRDGLSSYELAVLNGFIGTEQEYLEFLEGRSSYTAVVFRYFQDGETVTRPTGGSYENPIPVGWSVTIPQGNTGVLYMSTRIFNSKGEPPHQDVWSLPIPFGDAASMDVEYSSVISNPGTPLTSPNNWDDEADPSNYWMAVRTRVAGSWTPYQVFLTKGVTGQVVFTSIVFKLFQEGEPITTPTGGSFLNPIPNGWHDTVPMGTGTLYFSTRVFTDDGLPPQQSTWSVPHYGGDTDLMDIDYSLVKHNPGTPETHPSNWSDTPVPGAWWMAIRVKIPGTTEWGEWQVFKVQGEKGDTPEMRYARNTSFSVPPAIVKTDRAPAGWSLTPPASQPGYYIWETSGYINGDNELVGEWNTPIRYTGDKGDKGDQGDKGDKGDAGSNAPLLILQASSQIMSFDEDGSPKPASQVINLEVKLQNISGTATFTAIPYTGTTAGTAITLGGSGNNRTLTQAHWGANVDRVVVRAVLGSLNDTVTIVRVQEGKDSIVGFLTNESITLSANSEGTGINFSDAKGRFVVVKGNVDISEQVNFSRINQSGCTVTISNTTGTKGEYVVATMPADTATATFRATIGNLTIDKILSLSKSKQGNQGNPGADGDPGNDGIAGMNTYRMVLYRRGASAPAKPTGTVTYNFTTDAATGINNSWSRDIPASNGQPCWAIGATVASRTNTGTIAPANWSTAVKIVEDGASGTNGTDSFRLDLTNETSSVPASNTGAVQGSIPGTSAIVYKGNTVDTGWSFAASFTGCTGSIAASTGVVTISTMTADSASVNITATKSGNPTLTTVYTLSKVRAGGPGEDAVVYYIIPSANSVKISKTGAITPSTLTCAKYKRVGSSAAVVTTELSLRYQIDSAADQNYTGAVTVPSSAVRITFKLYDGSTLIDSETVPVLRDGSDGSNGINQATIFLFRRTAAETPVPAKPSANVTYTFATGVASGVNNSWSRSLPATDDRFSWMTQATAIGSGATDTIAPSEWTTPVLIYADGVPGELGPALAYRGDWNDVTIYRGSSTVVDFVVVGTNGYVAKVDAGDIPAGTPVTNDDFWNGPIPNSDAIFTDYLVAYSAYIDNLSVGSIRTSKENLGERTTIGFTPTIESDPTKDWSRHGIRQYYPEGNIMMYMGYVPSFNRGDRTITNQWATIVWKKDGSLHFTLDSDSEGGVEYQDSGKRWYPMGGARQDDIVNSSNPESFFFDSASFEQAQFSPKTSIFCGNYDFNNVTDTLDMTLGIKNNVTNVFKLEEAGQPTKYVGALNSEVGLNGWFLATRFRQTESIHINNFKVFAEYALGNVELTYCNIINGILQPASEDLVVSESYVGFTYTILNTAGSCPAGSHWNYFNATVD